MLTWPCVLMHGTGPQPDPAHGARPEQGDVPWMDLACGLDLVCGVALELDLVPGSGLLCWITYADPMLDLAHEQIQVCGPAPCHSFGPWGGKVEHHWSTGLST